ncbi:phage tail protein, partial [Streptomyces sp. NPDC005840]
MSRAAIPGLPSRYPIGEQLPALYAEDDFAQRFTSGLDTVLAP